MYQALLLQPPWKRSEILVHKEQAIPTTTYKQNKKNSDLSRILVKQRHTNNHDKNPTKWKY